MLTWGLCVRVHCISQNAQSKTCSAMEEVQAGQHLGLNLQYPSHHPQNLWSGNQEG